MAKPIVLTLLGVFWPGNDATGPNQSFRGMTETLSDDFSFHVVARDRGSGVRNAVRSSGVWTERDGVKVRYASVGPQGARDLGEILRTTPHDMLMLNGFFDREFTIPTLLLRRLGRVPLRPTILSPRGEFASGAMSLKSGRKAAWRAMARRTGLLHDIWLHGSTESEAADIARGLPGARGYLVAPDIRGLIEPCPHALATEPVCRLTFLGRISPVKNLDYGLALLAQTSARVALRIFGPCENPAYWERCQQIIAGLPRNVVVSYEGEIANATVPRVMANTDLLFLPTKGENFSHTIFEALSCGVPALISDMTPWRDLERHAAGWDLPLDDPGAFARAIDEFASFASDARAKLRLGARRLAENFVREGDAVGQNRELLNKVLGGVAQARISETDVFPAAAPHKEQS
ncbi:MAG: glycosyltransferase family 4 protein [Methylocystis sp.]|uniref:glycosyltransferase family 4 protein n=1 Tax=Methylocystis sp. TaxID=1911079 RepID=UPI003DA6C38F